MCVTKKLTNLQNGITEYAVFWGIYKPVGEALYFLLGY